jgi:adenosylcobinamide-GDP ribazoletransferase
MTKLILAIQFLTRLPTPQINDFKEQWLVDSARWFPLVGLIIGLFLVMVVWSSRFSDVWLSAWLGVLTWIIITGGLHLDGIADLADGLGATHRDKSRLLAVMKDPHLGSFGVLTLITVVTGKLVLLMLIAKHQLWWPLLLIPAWARLGIYHWQSLPPLAEGMAEKFTWQIPYIAGGIWLISLAILSLLFAPALLLAPLYIVLYRHWLHKNLGGVSGDCLGAGVELLELSLLLTIVICY